MSERKRVKRNIEFTNDISETGLTKEQFDLLSEYYEDNANIIEDSDSASTTSTRRTIRPETSKKWTEVIANEDKINVEIKKIDDRIITALSSHHGLKPNVVRKLLGEYETLKKTEMV